MERAFQRKQRWVLRRGEDGWWEDPRSVKKPRILKWQEETDCRRRGWAVRPRTALGTETWVTSTGPHTPVGFKSLQGQIRGGSLNLGWLTVCRDGVGEGHLGLKGQDVVELLNDLGSGAVCWSSPWPRFPLPWTSLHTWGAALTPNSLCWFSY